VNSPQVGVGFRGKLFDCPVDAQVWTEQGALSWEGVLHVRDKGISDLIDLVDTGLLDSDDPVRALVALVDQLIGSISFDLGVLHRNDLTRLELDLDRLKLRVLRSSATTALAVYLTDPGTSRSDSLGWILKSLHEVQSALGLQRLFLVYRRAPGITLSELTGEDTASLLPSVLSNMAWLACGKFAFAKDSSAGEAISSLLGISALDAYLGLDPAKSSCVACLSACKTEMTFFLSGHVEFLGLFRLDARVVYASRYLSLHTEYVLWGIRVVLQLDISWFDYSHSRFAFKLQIDTSELLAALAAVTQSIDQAIQALKATMASAQAALNAAQGRVDQLRHEIGELDSRIAACKEAIDQASWWQKVFVAIAKGAEIAAYEVAEAGIWTAIGVATAALEVAKLAVALFGRLGSAILELVNSTIRAATSLLFLRSAEILADISPQQQKFRAAIAFRALGKDYQYAAEVSLDLLQGGDLMKFLSDQLLGLLGPDLANVSQGKPPRLAAAPEALYRAPALGPLNAFVTTRENLLDPDSIPPIEGAAREIERVTGILELMQTRYRETFGADLAEFAGLNANFATALHLSASSLNVASQAAQQPEYSQLLQGVSAVDASDLPEADKTRLQVALDQLNDALQTRSQVTDAQQAAESAQLRSTERTRVSALPGSESASVEETDQRMVQFLTELEREIHERYGDAVPGYIDLSLEPALKAHFEAAHRELGSVRPAPLRAARAESARAYRPRL